MINFSEDIRKLPNIISLSRLLFGAPVTIVLYHNGFEYAWVIFLFFVALDWLDGFIARLQKTETGLGMLLDPLADQFLVLSIVWYFFWNVVGNINLPILLTIRELLMLALRLYVREDIPANILGKLKVLMEYLGIVLLLSGNFIDGLFTLLIAVLLAYASFFIYASLTVKVRCENNRA